MLACASSRRWASQPPGFSSRRSSARRASPGLYWFDAWSFWVPKAKAIYFFGGLDEEFFTELPGASYPLLVPVLDAAAFHAMGARTS